MSIVSWLCIYFSDILSRQIVFTVYFNMLSYKNLFCFNLRKSILINITYRNNVNRTLLFSEYTQLILYAWNGK